ncbi:MAG: flagellar export chaperone FlgN [Gracilimonas sp.]|uniref:flagellar export chaperone FlgN n=1 Tax=Gracilimonas TaxID=649462 RepID=UPI001AFD0BA0|nr:flagellar export chaperone FlgN [Gracilimonas sp.]MBO6586826.1 flagellar export chaperone FlgN [Gracilimonas sp.]MBO6614686.1 flagellar export chaperone FlgN [Gracilimonas sp.]
MYNISDTTSLEQIAESVDLLHNCSKQIIKVMEDQIDAIIASNALRIEELSEVHGNLSKRFKIHEQEFISELSALLATSGSTAPVRLVSLKEVFPESVSDIENWHKTLTADTKELQRKHNQILQLLEFAMSQNARMMQSMYSVHNSKNTHYAPTGQQKGITTGVALNQEI